MIPFQNCSQTGFEAMRQLDLPSNLALKDIKITEPIANFSSQSNIDLKGTCSSNVNVEVSGDIIAPTSVACVEEQFSAAVVLSNTDGSKNIVVKQVDSLGNEKVDSRNLIKDTTPPNADILNIQNGAFVKASVLVSGICETGLSVVVGVGTTTQTVQCTAGMFGATLNLATVNDGALTLQIKQTDLAGLATTKQRNITKDTLAPVVAIQTPAAGATVTSPVALTGSCETGRDVVLSGTGVASSLTVPCASSKFSATLNLTSGAGARQVVATQTDAAGNSGSDTKTFQAQTPTVPPIAISITAPAANTVAKDGVTLAGTCQNGLTVEISGTGVQSTTAICASGQFSKAIVFSTGEGTKVVSVKQTNTANGATGTDSRSFVRDTVAPTLTIATPAANTAAKTSLTLTGSCETGVSVVIAGTGATAATATCTSGMYSSVVTLSNVDGTKQVTVTQTDAVGNSTTVTRNFIKDTTAPTVTIASPAANTSSETGLTITGACETGLSVTASGTGVLSTVTANCTSSAYSVAILFSANDGTKAVEIAQTDAAGNKGTATRSFTRTTAPVVYDGAQLYNTNCAACHNALATSTKIGRTSSQISLAINSTSNPAMNTNSALKALSSSQIQAIADALADKPAGVKQLVCTSSGTGNATDMRRLTKLELSNTLSDLLGANIFADLEASLSQLPEAGFENKVSEFQNQYNSTEVEALANLAFAAANSAVKNDTNLNALLSANSTCTSNASVTTACVDAFIANFGLKTFRRPLTAAEITTFKNIYASGADTKDKFSYLITSFLQMPQFLYHVELGTAGVDNNMDFTITPYEAASRMSYMIWGTMPSTQLFQQAANGDLNDATKLSNIVATMMTDERASAKVTEFFKYWLHLKNVPNFPANAAYLNGLNTSGLNNEMIREMNQFVNHIVFQQKKGYQELLNSKVSFAKTAALASIYEHPLASNPDAGTQVMGQGRKGILMRGTFLAYGDTENHPIIRASKLRQRVLCDTLGAPPATADTTNNHVDTLEYIQAMNTRERMTIKTSPAECMGCHSQMNPLGFALEEFDSFGRRTLTEKNYDRSTGALLATHTINPVVSDLNIETGGKNSSSSAEEFVDAIASSDKAISCFSRQIFRFYKVQQEDLIGDGCLLASMRDTMNGNTGSIQQGIMTLVKDTNFRKKKVKP